MLPLLLAPLLLLPAAPPEADRDLVNRLEAVRLARSPELAADPKAADAYAAAFRDAGLDVLTAPSAETAAALAKHARRDDLIAALDDWLGVADKEEHRKRLAEVLLRADPDPWRTRLRTALAERDAATVKRLAADEAVARQSPALQAQLGAALLRADAVPEAVAVLRQAQRRHPGDFRLNLELGEALQRSKPARTEEALRYLTAANALRPDNAAVLVRLGGALAARGEPEDAAAALRSAVRLDPQSAAAHVALGDVLTQQKKPDEAVACYRAALAIRPDSPRAHVRLGQALLLLRRTDEAIACFRESLRLDPPDDTGALVPLAMALLDRGQPAEAEESLRQAVRLRPELPEAHRLLALALLTQKKNAEAEAELRKVVGMLGKAVQEQPSDAGRRRELAEAHRLLARVLLQQGKNAEAEAELRQAIRLHEATLRDHPDNEGHRRDLAAAFNDLAMLLHRMGRPDDGVQALRQAVDLCPTEDTYHFNLALMLESRKDRERAVAELRRAVELAPPGERRDRYQKLLKEWQP